jgi:hypothetical protein
MLEGGLLDSDEVIDSATNRLACEAQLSSLNAVDGLAECAALKNQKEEDFSYEYYFNLSLVCLNNNNS